MFNSSGNSFFDNFDDILQAITFYRSIVLPKERQKNRPKRQCASRQEVIQ